MTCSICNSTQHFRARCPQNTQRPPPPQGGQRTFLANVQFSPLDGLAQQSASQQSFMLNTGVCQPCSASARSEPPQTLALAWEGNDLQARVSQPAAPFAKASVSQPAQSSFSSPWGGMPVSTAGYGLWTCADCLCEHNSGFFCSNCSRLKDALDSYPTAPGCDDNARTPMNSPAPPQPPLFLNPSAMQPVNEPARVSAANADVVNMFMQVASVRRESGATKRPVPQTATSGAVRRIAGFDIPSTRGPAREQPPAPTKHYRLDFDDCFICQIFFC